MTEPKFFSTQVKQLPQKETDFPSHKFFNSTPGDPTPHTFRLIPPTDNSGRPYKTIHQHWKQGNGEIKRFPCKIPCHTCQEAESTKNHKLRKQTRHLYPIIDRNESQKGGRPLVKFWAAPPSVHEKIIELLVNPPGHPMPTKKTFWQRLFGLLTFILLTVVGRKPKP